MTKRKMGMTESRSAFIHNWQVNSFLLRIIHYWFLCLFARTCMNKNYTVWNIRAPNDLERKEGNQDAVRNRCQLNTTQKCPVFSFILYDNDLSTSTL